MELCGRSLWSVQKQGENKMRGRMTQKEERNRGKKEEEVQRGRASSHTKLIRFYRLCGAKRLMVPFVL